MFRIFLIGLVIVSVNSLSSCTFISDGLKVTPTDSEIIAIFSENRRVFEELVAMSNEDTNLIRIAFDFTYAKDTGLSQDSGQLGIKQERWNEYKDRFRIIGLDSGITRGEDGSVWFDLFSRGLSVSGSSKGVVFSVRDLGCRNESLDIPEPFKESRRICRKIDQDWYLFLQS